MTKLKIIYSGIDGTSPTKLPSLAAAARYAKSQDLGPDFRRPWGLQGEYGQFRFEGFVWTDIFDGSIRSGGSYKASLLAEPPKMSIRPIKPWYRTAAYARGWKVHVDGEGIGSIFEQDDGQFKCDLFQFPNQPVKLQPDLKAAKAWVRVKVAESLKADAQTPGA